MVSRVSGTCLALSGVQSLDVSTAMLQGVGQHPQVPKLAKRKNRDYDEAPSTLEASSDRSSSHRLDLEVGDGLVSRGPIAVRDGLGSALAPRLTRSRCVGH